MAIIVPTGPGRRFIGTDGDDLIVGDGRPGLGLFGGRGDDNITSGITTGLEPGQRIPLYGGRPVANPVAPPETWARDAADLFDDGDDVIHIGPFVEGNGGSGSDTYVAHPSPDPETAGVVRNFNALNDTLILPRALGWEVSDVTFRDVRGEDGAWRGEVKSFLLTGYNGPGPLEAVNVRLRPGHDPLREGGVDEYALEVAFSGRGVEAVENAVGQWIADGVLM